MKPIFPVYALVSFLLLSGCALFNQLGSGSNEQLMAAAGFQIKPVQTPQQVAVMNSLQPYTLTMRSSGSNVYYIYADPKRNIVYVGGPQEYQKYQQLSVQQGIAEDQMVAAAEMQMLATDEMGWWGF